MVEFLDIVGGGMTFVIAFGMAAYLLSGPK